MPKIDLATAVYDIVRSRKASKREPFFFIVGAGLSAPQIWTASQITEDCRRRYHADQKKYGMPPVSPPADDPLTQYSYWFERALPQPILRQNYLKALIEDQPISEATFRLAHLLSTHQVASIVVTPNFDDFLYQALLLFGKPPILCDHPRTTARIDPENTDSIQIIHVHGTYRFYDCCNLRTEISERSTNLDTASTMPELIDQLLSMRSPIVIGYSGWEHDVIMKAIRQRLAERPASNLYWFCHTSDSYGSLPEWLRENPHVMFILPQSDALVSGHNHSDAESESELDDAGSGGDDQKNAESSELTAVQILDAFNSICGIDEPLITRNPFEYLAQRLEAIYERGRTADGALALQPRVKDYYDFSSVVDRLRAAATREQAEVDAHQKVLEQVRKAVRQSKYRTALRVAEQNFERIRSSNDLSNVAQFAELLQNTADGLPAGKPEALRAMREAAELLEMVSTREGSPERRRRAARAWIDLAKSLSHIHNHHEAAVMLDNALALLQSPSDSLPDYMDACIGKGYQMLSVDPPDTQGFEWLNKIIALKTPKSDASSSVLRLKARALFYKARFERDLGRYDDAIRDYKSFISRYEANSELSQDVATAHVNIARCLYRSGKLKGSLEYVLDIHNRYSSASEYVRAVAQEAILIEGMTHEKLGNHDEAKRCFITIADEPLPGLRPLARLNAMEFLARVYQREGSKEQSVATERRILSDYSDSSLDHVKLHVARIRKNMEKSQTADNGVADN